MENYNIATRAMEHPYISPIFALFSNCRKRK